jgi:hypothetical protein
MNGTDPIAEFRHKLKEFPFELSAKQVEFCDDACLRRYLVAYKQDLEKAWKGLEYTLKWREEYGVDDITLEDVEMAAKNQTTYTNGFDQQGRPIVYIKKKKQVDDHAKQVRLVVYTLEQAIKRMPPGVEQWVIIFDMQDYTRENAAPFHISKQTLEIFSYHYPERLGNAYFTFSPRIYSFFWGLLSPFIDAKTRGKIQFLGTSFDALGEKVAADQLERKYGGDLDFSFDIRLHYT